MATYGKITTGSDFVYYWRLDNFLERLEANGERIHSPNFGIIDNNFQYGTMNIEISITLTYVLFYIQNKGKENLTSTYRLGPYLNSKYFFLYFRSLRY